jgi:FtsZ-interacting cell division protein ZipA
MSKLSTTTKYEPQNQDWAKQMLHEQKTQDSAFSEPKTPVPNPPDKVFGKRGPRKSTNPPNENREREDRVSGANHS